MLPSLCVRGLLNRVYLPVCLHVALFVCIYGFAFGLRFDFEVPPEMGFCFCATLPWVLGLKLAIFYFSGNYRGWWRYVTFADLVALLQASTLATVGIAAIDHFLPSVYHIPRNILLLDWALSILVIGGVRSFWRFSREQFWPFFHRNGYRRALIVGADQTGLVLAKLVQSHPRPKYRVVGFLDADPANKGSRLGGIPVLGGLDNTVAIAAASGAEDVLVASASVPGKRMRDLMGVCGAAGLALKVLPAMDNFLTPDHPLLVRDVDINDLLRRDAVELDWNAIGTLLGGRTILVTGAGGSIGSEICRQVMRFKLKSLVLVERAENNLFNIDRELRSPATKTPVHPCMADVQDQRRMKQLFERYEPEVVFHAAAHKHVPMMEINAGEALKNNVLGTKRLADLAHRHGVISFVMVSTDKAVNPSSIMGVSKQLAERYVHALSQGSATKFVVVRFGNVLGSAGSVVPIFQEQIRRGGPITVTHPEMERYFMTIPEASQLVLQAAAMSRAGDIFVLDMGEPVKIVDLARDLIRLSGLSPDDIEIEFTGTRPGEKLYEELYVEEEEMLPTPHPKLSVAYHRPYELAEVRRAIARLVKLAHQSNDQIREELKTIVLEYESPDPPRPPRPGRQDSTRDLGLSLNNVKTTKNLGVEAKGSLISNGEED